MSTQVLTERESQRLGRLRELGLNKFDEYLTQLINQCEVKKTEMYTIRKQLKVDKKKAVDLKKRGSIKKAVWTSVNCLCLAGGTIALFVPGLGWGAMAIGAAGSIGATYGNKKSEESNKKETDALYEAVSEKSGNCISVAKMAINKKNEFEAARARLISGGSTEEQANVLIILAMIEESFQKKRRLTVGDNEAQNSGNFACIGAASFEIITENEIRTAVASVITENQNSINDWLLKGVKYVAKEVPSHVLKKMSVAFAVVAVSVNIYQLAKNCIEESKACVLIEEIYEMLEEGEHSLQFFINLLHTLKEGIQRQINVHDREESDRRIASLTNQIAVYSTTIDSLQSQIEAQAATIVEMKKEFQMQFQQQNQAMYNLAFCLQNGIQLPPQNEFMTIERSSQSPRKSIENSKN